MYLGPEVRLASLITEPSHSLINQSVRSRERSEPLNGDGFGVAWYRPETDPLPATFRSISPAWSNRNLQDLSRVTQSACVLAHVRAASPGLPVTETNCHPFAHDGYAFMHNGSVGDFRRLRRAFVAALSPEACENIDGTTDSEHVFGLFLDRVRAGDEMHPAERLAAGLEGAIADALEIVGDRNEGQPVDLNLAVSDGQRAAATRFTTRDADEAASLYVHAGGRYRCQDGVCSMVDADTEDGAVIIASEPLSADPGWEPVPANHVVVVGGGTRVETRALGVGG
ncbi:MAG: hypothetical protein CMJ83_15570 [Planctomycetes bacterium]|nr:hypothetical protein [Planctomycetota bacterium]